MIQVIHFMSHVFSNEVVSCMLIYVKIHPCRTPEVLSGSSSSREAKARYVSFRAPRVPHQQCDRDSFHIQATF